MSDTVGARFIEKYLEETRKWKNMHPVGVKPRFFSIFSPLLYHQSCYNYCLVVKTLVGRSDENKIHRAALDE